MKDALTLIVLLVVGAGGYATYRYSSLPTAAHLAGDLSAVRGLPAAVCSFTNSGFESSGSGTLYIHKGKVRVEGVFRQSGRTVPVHLVITPEKKVYSWIDGDHQGRVETLESHGPVITASSRISCAPWWLPDAALLSPPRLITFDESA